jgi:hypothetical protein
MAILKIWVMEWTLSFLAPPSSILVSTMDHASSWCALIHSGVCKILEGL